MKTFSTLVAISLLVTALAFCLYGLSGCPPTLPGAEGEEEGEGAVEGEGEPGPGNGDLETETVKLPGNVPLEMILLPAGTFTMGSPDTEALRDTDEGPQHQVTLSHGFWMAKYELTQIQWKAVMGSASPSYYQGGTYGNTDNRPVEQVSWDSITVDFLPKLNTVTGKTFRLPTEAEWEYACRAGEHTPQTRFYWGEDPDLADIPNYAWYRGNSGSQTHEVGGKTANAFGLHDMSGGVWEWVQDYYAANAYTSSAVTDPTGPTTGSGRVLRGGSWDNVASYYRSASRYYYTSGFRNFSFGFRVVRNP